ncbi:hypothetical protein [Streptomyces sp. MBT65]|uniref:hypothetical protein n=1 Tax=Streptomyces sp. MBT65 TaxID=1488395 RepID=UPI001F48DA75|nr:hypothetical protein [Streptomyces sp. MBT65]
MTAELRLPLPDDHGHDMRATLAALAPGRLAEMQATKDGAFAKVVEWESHSPVRGWELIWGREIEIARRPVLSARYAWARNNLEHEDPAVAREALGELSAVLDEAVRAALERGGDEPTRT